MFFKLKNKGANEKFYLNDILTFSLFMFHSFDQENFLKDLLCPDQTHDIFTMPEIDCSTNNEE